MFVRSALGLPSVSPPIPRAMPRIGAACSKTKTTPINRATFCARLISPAFPQCSPMRFWLENPPAQFPQHQQYIHSVPSACTSAHTWCAIHCGMPCARRSTSLPPIHDPTNSPRGETLLFRDAPQRSKGKSGNLGKLSVIQRESPGILRGLTQLREMLRFGEAPRDPKGSCWTCSVGFIHRKGSLSYKSNRSKKVTVHFLAPWETKNDQLFFGPVIFLQCDIGRFPSSVL